MSAPLSADRPWPRVGRLQRYGPVLLILLALVAAGTVATIRTQTKPAASRAGARASKASVPPTYAAAEREGRTADYQWGRGCDRTTGRLEMPTVYAPPCVPVFHGTNGGRTWNGVSATTINVVYYQAQPGLLSSVASGATAEPTATLATAQDFVTMLDHVVELYGRQVHLIHFQATGAADDSVAAQADAVDVAEQLHAFASIGGPLQTSAYEEELASLHVLCVGCASSATSPEFQTNAPYIWSNLPTVNSLLDTATAYIIEQLNGKPAIWAGNPAWHHRTRVFVVVNEVASPPTPGEQQLTQQITKLATTAHVRMATDQSLTYTLDLTTLPEQAATLAAKLNALGATTVVFAGDPVMPIYLTKACAELGYFPEWLITGTLFTDTSTLGRYYDQAEWSHAFGISSLPVPTPIDQSGPYVLYRWWYGKGSLPPSEKTASLVLPPLLQLFEGIELAGPNLTPYTFQAGLFGAPPAGGAPTTPLDALGNQGAAPTPSYSWPADYTFVWWDPTARGPDEEGVQGAGLMRYVDGGKRYKDGTVPRGEVPMFSLAHSVTSYSTAPPGDRPPSYPPWPGSPAAR